MNSWHFACKVQAMNAIARPGMNDAPAGHSGWRKFLRIALVTETYPPEIKGVAMTLARMVEGLSRHGHHIQLARPRQESDNGTPRSNGVEHALVRGFRIPRYDSLKLGLPGPGLRPIVVRV